MSDKAAPLTEAQKLKAMRQIQAALRHQEHPTLRACGLTEDIAAAVANEGLVNVWRVEDEGQLLDTHRVTDISEAGFGVLSTGHVAEPDPLRVSVVPQHKSVLRRIYEGTRSGLWDLIKVATGVALGWYLKRHFP